MVRLSNMTAHGKGAGFFLYMKYKYSTGLRQGWKFLEDVSA
jgi:hypothetical protein